VALVVLLNRIIPHEHLLKGYEEPSFMRDRMKHVWLVTMAILIHNLPEGLAVDSSSIVSSSAGLFAVSFPIAIAGKSKKRALGISVLSGLSEMLMVLMAALLSSTTTNLLVLTLSLAAGSMIYVISHEVIPETHRYGYENHSTLGFIVMLWLDTILD
jgi:ZIP family zinc transporter